MNKFGMVLGVAAVATLAGCKDPDYKYGNETGSQNDVKQAEAAPVAIESAPDVKKCQCPPGAKHTSPCACGAADCMCIVEVPPPVAVKPVPPPVAAKPVPPPSADSTTYIVQRGDSLSKIAYKYHLRISDIRKANPKIKKDIVWVGQRLKLPGKVEVGEQKVPEGAFAKPPKRVYVPYSGATKEYVVKNGDTLGAIAYGSGITIKALKDLNGLKSNSLKIGQKLKVPAEKVAAVPAKKADAVKDSAKKAEKLAKAEVKEAAKPAEAAAKPAEAAKATEVAPAPAPSAAEAAPASAEKPADANVQQTAAPVADAAPAVPTTTYIVQDGDDMTGVSIRWNVSAATIRELNNLPDDAQLTPGQILKLPADAQP